MNTRRHFISSAGKLALLLPFTLRASSPPPAKKPNLVFLIVVGVVLCVLGVIFYQLYKLCKKVLPNTPAPDNGDKNSNSVKRPMAITVTSDFKRIPLGEKVIQAAFFWKADRQTDEFLDPSGIGYYDGFAAMNVETSTDLQNWEQAGSISYWMNDDYIRVEQVDSNGVLSSSVTQNWRAAEIPSFSGNFPQSDKRFFRITSKY